MAEEMLVIAPDTKMPVEGQNQISFDDAEMCTD